MTKIEEYEFNGFLNVKLQGQALNKTCSLLKNIFENELSDKKFNWQTKYDNTFDLRPDVYTLDNCFVNLLFENDIDVLLSDLISSDITLMHIQLRRSFPGPSYMDWHRDSYVYDNRVVGNFPPVHKLIFYPTIINVEPKLKVAIGSHRRNFDNKQDDFAQLNDSKIVTINSSNENAILFNTNILHAVVPDSFEQGSFRLIYTFMRRNILKEKLKNEKLHIDQSDLYEKFKGI